MKAASVDLAGDAILNADGHSWRVQRKAGVRFLTRARVRHLVRDVLPRLYHQCIEKRLDWAAVESGIDKSAAATVDMGDVFRGLTTGVMAEMAFDVRPRLEYLLVASSTLRVLR